MSSLTKNFDVSATKRNVRRFYRYERTLKMLVKEVNHLSGTGVYSNGVEYVNPPTLNKYKNLKDKIYSQVNLIQHQRVAVNSIVTEFFEKTDFALRVIKLISKGYPVARDRKEVMYLDKRYLLTQPFKYSIALREKSPRTYELLKKIEEQFLLFGSLLTETIEKSTNDEVFFSNNHEVFEFIPELKNLLKKKNISPSKSHLLQILYYMESILEVVFKPYFCLKMDHTLWKLPRYWEDVHLNISGCGISFQSIRKYPFLERYKIKIALNDKEKNIIDVDGQIIRCELDQKTNLYDTALDFYFPKPEYQKLLLTRLYHTEIEKMKEVCTYARN